MKHLYRLVSEGGIRPRFMGFSHWRYELHAAVFVLLPFNLITGGLRRLHHAMVKGFRSSKIDHLVSDAYDRGVRDGRKAAYDDGVSAGIERVLRIAASRGNGTSSDARGPRW